MDKKLTLWQNIKRLLGMFNNDLTDIPVYVRTYKCSKCAEPKLKNPCYASVYGTSVHTPNRCLYTGEFVEWERSELQ